MSELVCGAHLIRVFKSMYVNNGTAKMPIPAKFGPRVQIMTSKIWNVADTVADSHSRLAWADRVSDEREARVFNLKVLNGNIR